MPAGSSAIIEAAVTLRPRTCMHTLTPLKSSPTRAGGGVDRAVGAGRAPRAGAVVAQVGGGGGRGEPAGRGRREETAAGRQADIGVARVLVPRSRKRPKSSPGARPGEPRVQSVPRVMRLEMAAPPGRGAAAKSTPAVSRTKACVGSATRNEES